MELDDFRVMMGVDDKYRQFSNLRDRVIDSAVQQVNDNTHYNVSVSYSKVGREHRRIIFKFYKKGALLLTDDTGYSLLRKSDASYEPRCLLRITTTTSSYL